MNRSTQFYLAALLPVLTALAITFFFISAESRKLSEQSLQTLESFLIESKQKELFNYTSIALSSVEHIYGPADPDNHVAQDLVASILHELTYEGDDGYFFAYNNKGINIVHPKQPYRVGTDMWSLTDSNGNYLIQALINNAIAGGGFHEYLWEKPSSNEIGNKLSYSDYLEKWNWMIGTGVYLDDVEQQLASLQKQMDDHIATTTRIILWVAFAAISLSVIVNFIFSLLQHRKSEQKVDELSQRVIDLQEEERRRISHELHDGIVQLLVSVKYYFEYVLLDLRKKSMAVPEQLDNASGTLDQAINEVRRISREMHPRALDELGLSEAIEALANEFTKRTGITVELRKPKLRKFLPIDVSTSLYRVVQESLINIEKHSGATRVNIDIVVEKKWFIMTIEDNGGKQKANISSDREYKQGIGLRNLGERIDYHRGEFNYKFDSNGGKISVRIPITHFNMHREG